jgi:hypothetical protein
MDQKLIDQIAGKVIRRLNQEQPSQSPAASPQAYFAPWTSVSYESDLHPSQQLFNIDEATGEASAVRELVEFLETKECSIEKDKPCDHCGACRTLGF